jgi:hypothetical protein
MFWFTCCVCQPVWVLFTLWSVYYCSVENLFPSILSWNIAPEMYLKIVRSLFKHVFISLNILCLDLCFQHQYAAFNWCMWTCTRFCVKGGNPFEAVQLWHFIVKKRSFATWCSALCHKLIFPNLNISYLAAFYLYCGQRCSHFFEEVKWIRF